MSSRRNKCNPRTCPHEPPCDYPRQHGRMFCRENGDEVGDYIEEEGDNLDFINPEFDENFTQEDFDNVGLDLQDKRHHVERDFVVDFTGSCNDFNNKPHLTKWKPQSGKACNVFGRRNTKYMGSQIMEDFEGDLSKVVLIGAELIWMKNTGPVDVAIDFPGMKGSTFTRYSNNHNVVIPKYTNQVLPVNEKIFSADDIIYSSMMRQFGGFDEESIRSDLITVPNEGFVLVPIRDHPVVKMMEIPENQERLKINMDVAEPVGDKWYRVDPKVVDKCVNELCTQVLSSLPFQDFENYEVSLKRLDGRKWNDPKGIATLCPSNACGADGFVESNMNDSFDVFAKVKLTYAICDKQT